MDDAHDWKPARFDAGGSAAEPEVHDNFVYALAAHLERGLLVLHTHYRDRGPPGELTDVRFLDVIAHHFEQADGPCILFDIEEVAVDWVVSQWRDLFERGRNYRWPEVGHRDVEDLPRALRERGVRGYLVRSSQGLDGFVLAGGVEYRRREQPAEVVEPGP